MNEQLEQWLLGNPIHGEQCCPDFSCCRGIKYIAPLEVRKKFIQAVKNNDDKTRFEMLGMFLGEAFSQAYLAGLETTGEEH